MVCLRVPLGHVGFKYGPPPTSIPQEANHAAPLVFFFSKQPNVNDSKNFFFISLQFFLTFSFFDCESAFSISKLVCCLFNGDKRTNSCVLLHQQK